MKESFFASACIHGVQGGAVQLKDDAFYFLSQKLTIPEEYKCLRIPYEDIKSVSFRTVALLFPVAEIVRKDGKRYKFVIYGKKRFLKYMNIMCKYE